MSSALRLPDDDETELRWHGAVMAYGRCFVSSGGRGFKLEPHHLKAMGEAEKAAHGRVMGLRHEYVAHSGKNDQQRAMAVVLVPGFPNAPIAEQAMFVDFTSVRPTESELRDFRSLVNALMTEVATLFDLAEKSVVKHYGAKTPEQLRALLQPSVGVQSPDAL
ncbi:MAG: hypothetical protein JSS56_25270 [Proteobacteria bacterium]|nr:hypothetical protein [Pseudomonadota bacterium]